MLVRRSRMHRTPAGKPLALTARDMAVFRYLQRYRYLRSTYLYAFAGGASETRFKERLGDLFHEGYISRPEQQWQFADARYAPAIHESGAGGNRVLAETCLGSEAITFLAAKPHRQFAHAHLICACLASIELGCLNTSDIRFVAWPEILARAPDPTRRSATPFRIPTETLGDLVPDGMFGLEYNREEKKSYRFFALEIDRGTMPISRTRPGQTSYLEKLSAYSEVLGSQMHRRHLNIPNLLVLTLTTSEARKNEMIARAWNDNAAFLFKAAPERTLYSPCFSLFTQPWERIGRAGLCIAQAS